VRNKEGLTLPVPSSVQSAVDLDVLGPPLPTMDPSAMDFTSQQRRSLPPDRGPLSSLGLNQQQHIMNSPCPALRVVAEQGSPAGLPNPAAHVHSVRGGFPYDPVYGSRSNGNCPAWPQQQHNWQPPSFSNYARPAPHGQQPPPSLFPVRPAASAALVNPSHFAPTNSREGYHMFAPASLHSPSAYSQYRPSVPNMNRIGGSAPGPYVQSGLGLPSGGLDPQTQVSGPPPINPNQSRSAAVPPSTIR
jgi:hypothetical protein